MNVPNIHLGGGSKTLMIEVGTELLGLDLAASRVRSIRAQFRRVVPKSVKLLCFTNDSHQEVVIKAILHD